ncbi:hypothetical protein N7488_005113 [Penicillium malachiteum]|nr:hypothetical protein N7488_005113 [Penicillium malachiteum]
MSLSQHPALSRKFDDRSFIPLPNSDLYTNHDDDEIQRALMQSNQLLPIAGLREIWQSPDTQFNNAFALEEAPRFQSHILPATIPDTLYDDQDTTRRLSATGNEAWPSRSHPTHTPHIAQTEVSFDIQQ